MILRSGFIKCTNSFTCRTCNKFYGCKDFNWKCSYCYNKKTGSQFPWRDPEFRQKVNQWAIDEIKKTSSLCVYMIKHAINIDSKPNSQNFDNTKYIIKQIKEAINGDEDSDDKTLWISTDDETLWISAEKGEELLRRTGKDCDEKSHIICPLILDWWNMKHYNYRGFEMCYYGRFGDESDFEEQIKSIPPPLPNKGFV